VVPARDPVDANYNKEFALRSECNFYAGGPRLEAVSDTIDVRRCELTRGRFGHQSFSGTCEELLQSAGGGFGGRHFAGGNLGSSMAGLFGQAV